jgi:hypothetical protein
MLVPLATIDIDSEGSEPLNRRKLGPWATAITPFWGVTTPSPRPQT